MFKYISTPFYKALPNDKFVGCNCTAKATKFVLPTLPNGEDSITIKKTDSSANVITVIGEHGQMIDNATRQVETATVIGTITGSGNATVVVTAAGMAGSPLTLSVAVLNGDAITTTGGKIRNAISNTAEITDMFYVSGSGANIVLTQIDPIGNDATLNISIDNGTCTGLTTASTSTNTTAGVAVTIPTQNEYATFINNGSSWMLADKGGANVTETMANKTLTSPLLITPKLGDGSLGITITSANQGHAAPTATIPNIGDAADDFVMKDTQQTITKKILTAPLITDPCTTYNIGAHDYAGAAADWTLSQAEALIPVHKPTNANAPVNAIVASSPIPYIFINATGQVLTVKTAAGTGVAITSAKTAMVMSDGANVIALATESA